ncbi:acylphosphatase [Salipaludibacillus agaradhaerens]|uniref:acylphosphatase n=1 Tax=Salipaludibacillus agaradhaerens TaxID=76935 RepID=UPI0009962885|nr:acylphosphatase [Salipaludibacillus agaradhaerens]
MENNYEWLPHLDNSIPISAYGYKLCIYTIALEGWRRGLKVKFFNVYRKEKGETKLTVRFSLTSKNTEHTFAVSRGDLVNKQAISVCVDKDLTKKYLSTAGVDVPLGKSFTHTDSDEVIIKYFKSLNFPVVLKPTDAGGGKGVITNINSVEDLKQALLHVRTDLNYKNVILERYIAGEDHRVYVIGNRVIGVYKRIPANVIGDGKRTISELIDVKNNLRKKNPYLAGRLIKKDKEMENFMNLKGLSLKDIPKVNERVFVREKGSLSAGGEPIDVTDQIPQKAKDTAIAAAKAIPNLPQCAVDMIIEKDTGIGFVNEVNSKPQISNHLYPVEGKARDIPKAIIDYYFPETIEEGFRNDLIYFDFDSILPPLRNGQVQEITYPSLEKEDFIIKKIEMTGSFKKIKYKKLLKKQALNLKLHGFIKGNANNISIVISGKKDNIKRFITELRKYFSSDVTFKELEWRKPVKAGFEVVQDKVVSAKRNNKEIEAIKRKYESIENSTFWKMTKPVRVIADSFKSSGKKK